MTMIPGVQEACPLCKSIGQVDGRTINRTAKEWGIKTRQSLENLERNRVKAKKAEEKQKKAEDAKKKMEEKKKRQGQLNRLSNIKKTHLMGASTGCATRAGSFRADSEEHSSPAALPVAAGPESIPAQPLDATDGA